MPVSRSTSVRADLIELIGRELLGPRGGVEEEIVGTPRARYAVGALAPVTVDPTAASRLSNLTSNQETDDGADPNETGLGMSDIDPSAAGQRGVPVVTDEETGTADDEED